MENYIDRIFKSILNGKGTLLKKITVLFILVLLNTASVAIFLKAPCVSECIYKTVFHW